MRRSRPIRLFAFVAFIVLLFALDAQAQRMGTGRIGRPVAAARSSTRAGARAGVLARARAAVRTRVRVTPTRSAQRATPRARNAVARAEAQPEDMARSFGPAAQRALATHVALQVPEGARLRYVDDLSDSGTRFAAGGELRDVALEHAANPELPWRYIRDGCYARAHYVTHDLRARGIVHGKIFATVRPGASKYLGASNRLMRASWGYHVAALAYERNPVSGRAEPWVLDPAVDAMPLRPGEWLHRIGAQDTDVDVTSDQQIGPRGAPLAEPLSASHDEANTEWSKQALQARWSDFMDVERWRGEMQAPARTVTAESEARLRVRFNRVRVRVKTAPVAEHGEDKGTTRTQRFWADRGDDALVAQLKATVEQQRPLALVVNPVTREILSAGTPPQAASP